jgi:hypothetical protein
VRGHYQYVKEITHSHTYRPPFLPTLPHVLADLVALPMPLVAPLPGAVCLVRAMACPVARTSPALNRTGHPRKWPRKGFSHGPTFGGALHGRA